MNTSPIGIFDSGIGGLTVAHAIKQQLPNENIVYFGDVEGTVRRIDEYSFADPGSGTHFYSEKEKFSYQDSSLDYLALAGS